MPYCCDRWFNNINALKQHKRDSSSHNYCAECDIDFNSYTSLENHDVSVHSYCKLCGLFFGDDDDLFDHADDEDDHYACRTCVRFFSSFNALANHYDASHYYCRECNRLFQSANNLAHHHGSSVHTPRTIRCPGRACNKAFVSVSALIHHAESDTCPSGITRMMVNDYVARIDRRNIITNPSRMISGPDGDRFTTQDSEYWATERAWNGNAYECFLCEGEFRTLYALNQHLKSPRHYQPDNLYRCPKNGCSLEFSVLSALSQHVERGSCGVRTIRAVQNTLDSLTRGMRAIAF